MVECWEIFTKHLRVDFFSNNMYYVLYCLVKTVIFNSFKIQFFPNDEFNKGQTKLGRSIKYVCSYSIYVRFRWDSNDLYVMGRVDLYMVGASCQIYLLMGAS